MARIKLGVMLAASGGLIAGLILFLNRQTPRTKFQVGGSFFEFVVSADPKPGIFATSSLGDVTEAQLSGNPVQLELEIAEKRAQEDLAAALEKSATYDGHGTDGSESAKLKSQPETKPEATPEMNSLPIASLRMRSYRYSITLLRTLLVSKAIEEAAKREGLDRAGFIEKHIEKNHVENTAKNGSGDRGRKNGSDGSNTIYSSSGNDASNRNDHLNLTDSEFRDYIRGRGIQIDDLTKESETSLRAIASEMKSNEVLEKYAVDHLIKKEIVLHVPPPRFQLELPEGFDNIWGPDSAPHNGIVQIVYFGDFQCGPCRIALSAIVELAQKYQSKVGVSFTFFFGERDRESRMLAEAALCAREQKKDYFRSLTLNFVANPTVLDESQIDQAMKDVGVGFDDYRTCFLTRKHKALLEHHLKFATQIGVKSQPTVLVNGEALEGAITREDLVGLVEKKLR